VPWRFGSFELPETSVDALLSLAKLRPSDRFIDLGSGTGRVVTKAVELWNVKSATGVEIDPESRDMARRTAIRALTKDQLERVDFWLGDVYSQDFDYTKFTAVYDSFEEDEGEVSFYQHRFGPRLRVLKKDLPFVGYAPAEGVRKRPVWIFRMDMPLTRIRSKPEWASQVLGRPGSSIDDVFDYYKVTLSRRGISKKETRMALNHLERLVILRF
jgi:SAM-dependent methyltransferase